MPPTTPFTTSFAETALSVLGSPPIASPGRFLRSLPDIVRRILPQARYSSFLEALATGSRGCDIPARKTPSLPIHDNTLPQNSVSQTSQALRTDTSDSGCESQTPASCPDDDLVFRILYKTHGKYAWMNGRPIERVKVLKWLGGEYLFPVTFAVLNVYFQRESCLLRTLNQEILERDVETSPRLSITFAKRKLRGLLQFVTFNNLLSAGTCQKWDSGTASIPRSGSIRSSPTSDSQQIFSWHCTNRRGIFYPCKET